MHTKIAYIGTPGFFRGATQVLKVTKIAYKDCIHKVHTFVRQDFFEVPPKYLSYIRLRTKIAYIGVPGFFRGAIQVSITRI